MVGMPSVSIVSTVYNEASNIGEWLDALLEQTVTPDEIVIVDGGSTDGTVDAISQRMSSSSIPVVVIESSGANISQGRNLAIKRACGALIAVTDAGTRADRHWLERLLAPLAANEADVASGFFVPRMSSGWERALAATTLPDVEEIGYDRFLPSSRSVAFRREWFDAGVCYPEWLDYCEDLVWDLAMKRAGARFRFVPGALVTFEVRPSVHSFAVQYARYARGDGKAGLFARRHAVRYATYATLGFVLSRRRAPELVAAAVLGGAYVARPVIRLRRRDRMLGHPLVDTTALVPLVMTLRAIGDVAKMAGYPAGLAWRWRRHRGLGWRTAWSRVSPAGELFRPAALSRGNLAPVTSHVVESPEELR